MSARSALQAQLRQLQATRVKTVAIDTEQAERDERLARVMYELRRRMSPADCPETFEGHVADQAQARARFERMPTEWRSRYRNAFSTYARLLPTGFTMNSSTTDEGPVYTLEYDPAFVAARDQLSEMRAELEAA